MTLMGVVPVTVYQQRYPLDLPSWTFIDVIHNGSNAIIFLAENAEGKCVAIKRFKFPVKGLDATVIDYFLDGIQMLNQAHEPSLVRVYQAGIRCNALYLIMEYLPGETLKKVLQRAPLPSLTQRLTWFRQTTHALQRVHELGMLHLDLKTSNIVLRPPQQSVVLVDFGLETRLLLDAGFLHEDEIYCTPYYVSPERIIGDIPDERADLYALGVVLYELLVGEKPYESTDLGTLLKMHAITPIPTLPPELALFQPLLAQLLAKFPENRTASAIDVLYWLDQHQL